MRQLVTNVILTDTFANLGPIIGPIREGGVTKDDTIKFSFLTIAIDLTINDSKGVQIKPFHVDEFGDLHEFPLEVVKKDEVIVNPLIKTFGQDEDLMRLMEFEIDNTIDLIQLQVRAQTVGATAGVINRVQYGLGYRQ